MCYLGHLWTQIDLSQVDGLRQQVVEQLAEQHTISQSLSQVTHLVQHTHTNTHKIRLVNQDDVCSCAGVCVVCETADLPVRPPM